jgi:hypothetical protein
MALTKISRSLLDTGISDSSDATAITIDSSENVGIACTPHFPFDVQLNSSRRIGFNYSDSQNSILSHDGSGNIETLGLRGNTILFYSDYDASNPDGVERMRIDSSGNVGIGTTSPSFDLDIQDTSNTYLNVQATATSGEASLALKGKNSSGTDRTLLFKYDNSDLFRIATPSAVDIRFETSDAERMRIDSSGNVMVGTTSSTLYNATSGGGALFFANGPNTIARSGSSDQSSLVINKTVNTGLLVSFRKDGTQVGTISTNTNSLPSDRNFKRDISDLDLGLNLITKLKPSQYNYKFDDENAPKMYGLIAQDLEDSLTEVGVEKNSTWLLQHKPNDDEKESDYDLDYLKLTPVLINAIQEQQEQIEALQSEINTLKGG